MIRGIGVDAVDIERFRTSLGRTPSMRGRLFTEQELADVAEQVDQVRSLAARFAAREAVMKAMGLGLGAFGFPSGPPRRRSTSVRRAPVARRA